MTQEWIKETLALMDHKLLRGIALAADENGVPYSTREGRWVCQPATAWVSGFWPALMWQMYLETGKAAYRREALRIEEEMDEALRRFEELSHDVGFMYLPVSGVHYALENDPVSLRRLKLTASLLASRYNPNGFLRAWNDNETEESRAGLAIIDCMMNLPLLYTMSEITNDPRFALIATVHARTTARDFVRKDGSCRHIVRYDPRTGALLSAPAGQGYQAEPRWTRGGAWAIYGFALAARCADEPLFLAVSRRAADYFLSHLPGDGIAPIDFDQPPSPDLRDESAVAIAADGLIELAALLERDDVASAAAYRAKASFLLRALCARADFSADSPLALTGCSSKYHGGDHGITMTYADYFFVEALRKLSGETRLFWKPMDFHVCKAGLTRRP